MVIETAVQRLRVLHQKRGLLFEDTAKVLNCSTSTVSRIENDKYKSLISIDHSGKLADYYNVDVSYIVKGYQYPRDIQNVAYSAEENPEDADFGLYIKS